MSRVKRILNVRFLVNLGFTWYSTYICRSSSLAGNDNDDDDDFFTIF